MTRVSIVGTAGLPARYGGFETLAENLVKNLTSEYDVTVYCSGRAPADRNFNDGGCSLIHIPFSANGVSSISYDLICLLHASRRSDTILILGVSGCVFLPIIRIFTKAKIVTNIDGMEWKREKWGAFARRFLKLSERVAVRFSDTVISDSRVIRGYVKKQYNANSVYIPYGGDHIDLNASDCIERISCACTTSRKFALSICRIEPENNIEMILKAMKCALDYDLVVIGNWQDSSFSRALRAEFSNYDNVFLLDPIYDQRLLNQYRSGSSFYLHGHSAGGTNPSLVEAMYAGLPILAYAVDYNISTTHNQAVYFSNFSELISLVDSLSDDELSTIGSRMKSIAEREYVWSKISAIYESVLQY